MDFQQPHGYLRPPAPQPPPPPPPMADPYHHQPQTLPPPPPPPNPWYSNQFQFQQQSSSPPPHSSYPPPPHQPWPPLPAHPHSDQFASGHPPPPPYSTTPYSSHHAFPPQHNHYTPPPHQHSFPTPPPRPHVLPPHHIQQSYPQDWGNANWGHHQSWDYQANTNEEVWAAKARAWAAAKTVTDSQQAPYVYAAKEENVSGDPTAAFSGQDSSLSPLFHQQEVPSSYSSVAGDPVRMEPTAATTYVPPAETAVAYSSLPAVTSFLPQVEHSATLPSPLPGHSAPIFGRMPAPSFHATVSSISPSFAVGAGPNLHSVTAFSGDAYGVSGVPERPKKSSVPNWLREEIIKRKPVLFSSAGEHPKEDALLNEDEDVDKSYRKDDMADSKSADSSRSVEEEEDEDELDAARTAAINQEIKRVLTEILLKVTDELFDEIATEVLSEDDLSVEVGGMVADAVDKEIPVSSVSSGSAKVVVPNEKETKLPTTSEKSAPRSPGDLLGLASYASDDDEDDGHKRPLNERNNMPQQVVKDFPVGTEAERDDDSLKKTKESHELVTSMESDMGRIIVAQLGEDRAARETSSHDSQTHQKMESRVANQVVQEGKLKNIFELQVDSKSEKSVEDFVSRKSTIDDSLGQETRDKSDKSYRHEDRKNSVDKDHKFKDLEVEKENALERGHKSHNNHDKRIDKMEKRSDQKVSRDRLEDKTMKSAGRAKNSDSRGRSPPDYSKGMEKEKDNGRRATVKDDSGRKKERTRDVERDESRRTNGSSSSRLKRRRSSSVASRDRDNYSSSVVSHASDSSNESSVYSKRKLQSKRHKSPLPETVSSRKRQVSRSPHSKHSQHRHSYSSLEASRKRRSRSPVRRRR